MKAFLVFLLQLFADAGSLVTGSQNYVNAYTGDTTSFDSANSMNGEMKTFYDTAMLMNTRVETYYAQFAKRQSLPKNRGRTIEWRKWNTFAPAGKLQEGVIPTGQKFGMTSKTASIEQYGTYAAITDILQTHSYDPVIMGATEEMGASLAETQETLIRDGLYTNTNVMYCDNLVISTGAVYNTPTSLGTMLFNSTYACKITPRMVKKVATKMTKDRVPKINGKYYAVIHPSVAEDLTSDPQWIEFHKYAATSQIFNGEIGELHGVRFIVNTFAPVFQGADLASNSRTLTINYESGYSGAITSVAFDGGTVAADALIGRIIMINGVPAKITDNTTTTLTFASTNFGSIADNTTIYPGEGAKEGTAAYATYFFGKDAFGIVDPEGGNAQMIVKSAAEVGGPLEQFSTIGYKFETNGATILYTERVLRLMSCSSYSESDVSNVA